MKNIDLFLTEKLNLRGDNKDLRIERDEDFWWFSEIDDLEKMPKEFYDNRKSKTKKNKETGIYKNKPWYAVVNFLSRNPGSTWDEVRAAVWPGRSGQQSELGGALRQYNVMTYGGKKSLKPFSEWVVPKYSYKDLW